MRCAAPALQVHTIQPGRQKDLNHQDGGQEQSYHEAMAEGDIHSYQTLITDVPQGPRLLSLHLGTGGRPAFQGATTYSEGT